MAWSRSDWAEFCFATSSSVRFALICASSSAALSVGQVAFGLRHARLENCGIDLRDHLPRLHRRIEIREQFLDVARDLAADLHVDHRIERAGGRNRLRDCAPRHGGCLIFGRATPAAAAEGEKRKHGEQRRAADKG